MRIGISSCVFRATDTQHSANSPPPTLLGPFRGRFGGTAIGAPHRECKYLLSLLADAGLVPPRSYSWIALPVRLLEGAFGSIAATLLTLCPVASAAQQPPEPDEILTKR